MKHTFTPPTTFPHEYTNGRGDKCVVIAQGPDGILVGYVDTGSAWRSCDWDKHGSFGIASKEPDLRDLPKVTSTWQNVYTGDKRYPPTKSRESADLRAQDGRIAVLRRDTIDGVTTCELEPV